MEPNFLFSEIYQITSLLCLYHQLNRVLAAGVSELSVAANKRFCPLFRASSVTIDRTCCDILSGRRDIDLSARGFQNGILCNHSLLHPLSLMSCYSDFILMICGNKTEQLQLNAASNKITNSWRMERETAERTMEVKTMVLFLNGCCGGWGGLWNTSCCFSFQCLWRNIKLCYHISVGNII